jgi:hypothetical protein
LSPFLFSYTLEYAIRKIQAHQEGLKLNGTHQLLVCAGDVNLLAENILTVKRNTGALLVSSKESSLKVSAETYKCMLMSCEQGVR